MDTRCNGHRIIGDCPAAGVYVLVSEDRQGERVADFYCRNHLPRVDNQDVVVVSMLDSVRLEDVRRYARAMQDSVSVTRQEMADDILHFANGRQS